MFKSLLAYIRMYARHDLAREISTLSRISIYYVPVAAALALAALAVLFYINPMPGRATYLATGQRDTLTDKLGEAFQAYFQRQGLSLQVENRMGLNEIEKELRDPKSRINASFVISGAGSPAAYPDLVSLGNVALAPLWLFYRGDPVAADDPFQEIKDKVVAVGAPGTVSQKLFATLMEMNNPGTGDRPNFLKLPHEEAVERLLAGQIDALFIVDGFRSTLVQKLLNAPQIQLMNFPLADAYARRLPFLQKVTVPRGALDIAEIRPRADVALLASGVNLLVEKDTHPTVQWAFLMAARDTNLKTNNFFPAADTLPRYKDQGFPLSPVGLRFYTTGVPAFFSYLPFWLAAMVENVWVVLLALFLLALPAFKKLFGYRSFASQRLLWLHFWELRYLEDELGAAGTTGQVDVVIAGLQQLDHTVATTWVADDQLRHYFNLRRTISGTLQDARKKRSTLEQPS